MYSLADVDCSKVQGTTRWHHPHLAAASPAARHRSLSPNIAKAPLRAWKQSLMFEPVYKQSDQNANITGCFDACKFGGIARTQLSFAYLYILTPQLIRHTCSVRAVDLPDTISHPSIDLPERFHCQPVMLKQHPAPPTPSSERISDGPALELQTAALRRRRVRYPLAYARTTCVVGTVAAHRRNNTLYKPRDGAVRGGQIDD